METQDQVTMEHEIKAITDWWMGQVAPNAPADKVTAFGANLAAELPAAIARGKGWLGTMEGGPDILLEWCAFQAGIAPAAFPVGTIMYLREGEVIVKVKGAATFAVVYQAPAAEPAPAPKAPEPVAGTETHTTVPAAK